MRMITTSPAPPRPRLGNGDRSMATRKAREALKAALAAFDMDGSGALDARERKLILTRPGSGEPSYHIV